MYAKDYLKHETEEYYHAANGQHTVFPYNNTNLIDILNDEGMKLYKETLMKVENNDFKDILLKYCTDDICNSGMWIADESSPFYELGKSHHVHLNSFNNIMVHGLSKSKELFLTTSPVIFITDDWCLTMSGSLYALKQKITMGELRKMMQHL